MAFLVDLNYDYNVCNKDFIWIHRYLVAFSTKNLISTQFNFLKEFDLGKLNVFILN